MSALFAFVAANLLIASLVWVFSGQADKVILVPAPKPVAPADPWADREFR